MTFAGLASSCSRLAFGLLWLASVPSASGADTPVGRGEPVHLDLDHRLSAWNPVEPASHTRLSLVWFDVSRAAGPAYGAMKREVRAILGQTGVEVAWREARPGAAIGPTEISVILLHSAAQSSSLSHLAMGATPHTTAPTRNVWIYLQNVALTLGLNPRQVLWRGPEWQALGQALGRVVVHEVVHAIAPELPHDRKGLMAPTLGRAALLRRTLALAPHFTAAFRTGLLTRDEVVVQGVGALAALREAE